MSESRRTLPQACSPLFLYLATFWRNSSASKATLAELKQSMRDQLENVRGECQRDPRLAGLYERLHYALVAAADQVVLSSSWPQRASWSTQPLEKDLFKKLEGGKRFFRLVEEVLQDTGEDAVELAECLFTCMALGFRGELLGEKKELERFRRALFEKARLAGALGDRLTPEAYGRNAEVRAVVLPTANVLRLVALSIGALVFMILVWFFVVGWANERTLDKADEAIRAVEAASF